MANVAAYQEAGSFFKGEVKHVKMVYDFAEDAGAIGVLTLGTLKDKVLLKQAIVHVEEAVTSAGAPTVDIGFTGGDVDFFCAAQLKGALVEDAVINETTNVPVVIADETAIQMEIKVAALTAGKIALHLWYVSL